MSHVSVRWHLFCLLRSAHLISARDHNVTMSGIELYIDSSYNCAPQTYTLTHLDAVLSVHVTANDAATECLKSLPLTMARVVRSEISPGKFPEISGNLFQSFRKFPEIY